MNYRHLIVRRDGPVERLALNRPDVRNAFNETLVAELADWATRLAESDRPRVAVLSGVGPAFCAGADLGWMSAMLDASDADNLRDAERMAKMFAALDTLPIPLIGRIHGAALGGGCGLAAICDIVVAADDAVFGFTEVKFGLIPAVISPYALAKIGRSAARELLLTGARFSAARAREIGLVTAAVPADQLDSTVDAYVRELLGSGPEAVAAIKLLMPTLAGQPGPTVAATTAAATARRRVSGEGQEGMRAFLQKRRAQWRED